MAEVRYRIMTLVHLGIISTSVVIALGLAMVIPAFTQHGSTHTIPSVMLSFSIFDSDGVYSWCQDLAATIEKHDVKATVFLSGKTAEANPECVASFPANVDVGSQTYNYVNLTALYDYSQALEEVKMGKQEIDRAGNFDSRSFRAPYGAVDDNIYSLLNRSGITADFSYVSQYNKYENDQFVRYDLKSLTGDSAGFQVFPAIIADSDVTRQYNPAPVAVNFDSSMSIEQIDEFISKLQADYGSSIQFVNASDLAGTDLTIRNGEQDA